MKITRRKLRKLITEIFANNLEGEAAERAVQRSRVMDPVRVKRLTDIGREDPMQSYELATQFGSDERHPVEKLVKDLPLDAILVSKKPELLDVLGFKNLSRSISFDEKDEYAWRLAPKRREMAEYKASVLNKPAEDLMEIRYSWWESGYYMAIEEWIQNNPSHVESIELQSPYPNSEHILYTIKTKGGSVKILHISSADSDSTYTI